MTKLVVRGFSISIDGYGAGPGQSLANPLGIGGPGLHEWIVATKAFHQMTGREGGTTGPDNDAFAGGFANIGAWILGRNMFGPVRGPWPDESWKGWWGDSPPYHCQVFVLTHHPRESVVMEGGTVFHFVTEGIHEALVRASQAAGAKEVRLGGGVAAIRQYLKAGLIDEMRLSIAPVLLGSGEHLFADIDLTKLGYACTKHTTSEAATHVVLTKQDVSRT